MAIQNLDLRSMLRQFGVVTVMDVDVYKAERYLKDDQNGAYEEGEWDAKTTFEGNKLFSLKTLKIANINAEGPTKTATGGQNADVLLKYGKTFTIEMQDALGKYEVLEHIYGAQSNGNATVNASIVAITDRFPGELTLVGKTFVIDKATGAKQPLCIVIPFYLGDGIFNLTQDAEGDISVFDMNGNILRFSNGSITSAGIKDDNYNNRYLYDKGSDNQFYFFCTLDVLASFKAGKSYEEVWNNGAAPVGPEKVDLKITINGEEVELPYKLSTDTTAPVADEQFYYEDANGNYVIQIALDGTTDPYVVNVPEGIDYVISDCGLLTWDGDAEEWTEAIEAVEQASGIIQFTGTEELEEGTMARIKIVAAA